MIVSGFCAEDHASKESIIFQTFRHRLGSKSKHDMKFDVPTLIKKINVPDELTVPFIQEEIDNVIKMMSADRALDPDGFTGVLLKTCWDVIKEDFY